MHYRYLTQYLFINEEILFWVDSPDIECIQYLKQFKTQQCVEDYRLSGWWLSFDDIKQLLNFKLSMWGKGNSRIENVAFEMTRDDFIYLVIQDNEDFISEQQ